MVTVQTHTGVRERGCVVVVVVVVVMVVARARRDTTGWRGASRSAWLGVT